MLDGDDLPSTGRNEVARGSTGASAPRLMIEQILSTCDRDMNLLHVEDVSDFRSLDERPRLSLIPAMDVQRDNMSARSSNSCRAGAHQCQWHVARVLRFIPDYAIAIGEMQWDVIRLSYSKCWVGFCCRCCCAYPLLQFRGQVS
jgi:hypothetical protein